MRKFFTYILSIGLAVFSGAELNAGYFNITGSNYTTTGLYYTTSGAGFSVNASGFFSTGGVAVLQVGGFNIKKNQKWKKLTISATSTGGTYTLQILSKAGQTLYIQSALTTSHTVDLTTISQLSEGSTFQVYIQLSGINITISQIQVTYDGNSVICFPSPYFPSGGSLTIAYDLPADGKVTIKIYDNGGQLVKTIMNESYQATKNSRFNNPPTWDGRSDTGRMVATGVYTVVVEVRFLSASQTDYITYFKLLVIR